MNGEHSVYLSEGAVVRGQSKVEKAKYVHTENNLRRTLENIDETFKRTNKRLSEQTETVRSELHRLRQNIETVRQEKKERKTGKYQNKRRPYKAERFLCDENILTLTPFSNCSKNIATHRKPWAKKHSQKHLNPIRLHHERPKNNGDNDGTFVCDEKEQPDTLPEEAKAEQVVQNKLPKIVSSHYTRIAAPRETCIKRITTLQQHSPNGKQNFPPDHARLEVPKIPVCDLMDIQACRVRQMSSGENRGANFMQRKPYFLPPLDKITEGRMVTQNTSFAADNVKSVLSNDCPSDEVNLPGF